MLVGAFARLSPVTSSASFGPFLGRCWDTYREMKHSNNEAFGYRGASLDAKAGPRMRRVRLCRSVL